MIPVSRRSRPFTRLFRRLQKLDAGGRRPIGLIGTMVLLVGTELAASRLAPENLLSSAWRQTRLDAGTLSRETRILAVGDSQVKHGLAVRVLEERLGVPGYNLALQGATAPATYHVLRKALDAGARPRAILLNSALLNEDPFNWVGPYSELLSPWEVLELSRTARDGRIAGAIALSWLLPSYRERDGLRRLIKGVVTGRRFDTYWILQAHRRNWRRNLGALILAPPHEPPPFDHFDHVASIPWTIRPVNAEYLDRTLAMADERDIPVFWLLYPIHPGVRAARDPSGWNAAERALIESLLARYPRLTILDGLHNGDCPIELLNDLTHVNRLGAIAFSAAVADVLDRDFSGLETSRWITLPELRPVAVRAVVEDERESLEILKIALRAERLRRKGLKETVATSTNQATAGIRR